MFELIAQSGKMESNRFGVEKVIICVSVIDSMAHTRFSGVPATAYHGVGED